MHVCGCKLFSLVCDCCLQFANMWSFSHLVCACVCVWKKECNAEIMSIQGWEGLWRCAAQVQAWRSERKDIPGDRFAAVDLSSDSMPCSSWQNTVTITSSGSVIIRLSWKAAACWDEGMAARVVNACNAIALVLENCC
jgi:hypothetical protein